MAYKQNAGRGNAPKTGAGIPSPLLQMAKEVMSAADKAGKIAAKRKSFKDLSEREKGIETAAATDSILAAKPKQPYLYTDKEKGRMGNEAANKTRKANDSNQVVTRGEKLDKKTGYSDSYTRSTKK